MPRRRRPKAPAADNAAMSARIRAKRRARKVTQLALAEALGITFGQMQRRKPDRGGLSARRLQDIASLLDVSAAALTGSEGTASAARAATTLGLADSAGAMRLMRAYAALPTPRMKRALVNLAEQMAGVGL
jgi:transcriptional regulator with XRE-family HTH domain